MSPAARLRLEPRPDGSLLVTSREGAPRALGLAGVAGGLGLLGSSLAAGLTVFDAVLTIPAGIILALAGGGALRHRDWVLVDRGGRQLLHRRGLASIFRAVPAVPFDEVTALRLEAPGPGGQAVSLVGPDGLAWRLWGGLEPAEATALAAAVATAGRWPLERPEAHQPTGREA